MIRHIDDFSDRRQRTTTTPSRAHAMDTPLQLQASRVGIFWRQRGNRQRSSTGPNGFSSEWRDPPHSSTTYRTNAPTIPRAANLPASHTRKWRAAGAALHGGQPMAYSVFDRCEWRRNGTRPQYFENGPLQPRLYQKGPGPAVTRSTGTCRVVVPVGKQAAPSQR